MTSSTKYLLPILTAWAGYIIFDFALQNELPTHSLPDTDEKLCADMTGIASLDEFLSTLIIFFWPISDGKTPALTLHSLNFTGALASVWVLVVIESSRQGSRRGILMFPVIFGLLAQVATFAATMPLFFTVHLFTSSTALHPTAENISVPVLELWCIPLSITVGFIIPSIAMGLPSTLTESFFRLSKQEIIVIWQLWPVWVSIVQFLLCMIGRVFSLSPATSSNDLASRLRRTRSASRYTYAFAFVCAAVPHIIPWSISLSAYLVPDLLNPALVDSLRPENVFLNRLPGSFQPASLAQGCLWLLQWDHLVGAVAALVWAVTLYIDGHARREISVSRFGLVAKVGVLCLISGIAGAVVELMWERDEVVWEGELGSNSVNRKS